MDIKTIAPDLSVSPQISVQDVGIAASQGFKSLIINRPDGESSDQTAHAEIEAAAQRHGLEVRYVPVVSGKVTDADVEAFDKAMHELPAPALAYCRTGTRSATLWRCRRPVTYPLTLFSRRPRVLAMICPVCAPALMPAIRPPKVESGQ